jgi:multidrug resistance efflux pump
MKAEIRANRERLEAKIETISEKLEVLREKWARQKEIKPEIGAPVSRIVIHQAKTDANNEESMVAMKASHERIEAMMDVSLGKTEPCVEKFEANQEKVETKMEACLEEVQVEVVGPI